MIPSRAAWHGFAAGAFCLLAMPAAANSKSAFEAGIVLANWNPSYSGAVTIDERLNFRDDLALRGRSRPLATADMRFPSRRWLPELAVGYTRLRADGDRPIDMGLVGGVDLGPLDGIVGGLVPGGEGRRQSRIDVDDTYLTMRWRPLSVAGVALLPGTTLRRFTGELRFTEDGLLLTSERDSNVDELLPMLHMGLRWEQGAVAAELQGNWAASGDDRVYDAALQLWLAPQGAAPMRAAVGWRLQRFDVSGTDTDISARLAGVTVAVGARW